MDFKVGQEAILLGTIAQTLPDPIFIIDEEGNYVEVIGGLERHLYDSGDYLRKNSLHKVFPKAIADQFLATVKSAIVTNTLQLIEYELTSLDMMQNPMDGPTRPQWYQGRVYPLRLLPENQTVVIWIAINITEKIRIKKERDKVAEELKRAVKEIKTLRGILPLCSYCKKVRDDKGYWQQVDHYIQKHTEADVSHSICPECLKEHFPDMDIDGGG